MARPVAGPLEDHPTLEEGGGPDSVEEYLLHPVLLRAARHLRSGVSLGRTDGTVDLRLSDKTAQSISTWLKTGDFKHLQELIRTDWMLFAHPIVFWQVLHLWRVSRRWDEGELAEDGGNIGGGGRVSPAGTHATATQV